MISAMSPQDALLSIMMVMSAADRDMSDRELREIGAIVEMLPAFDGYDRDRITVVSEAVVDLLQAEDGLDTLLGMARAALPDHLRETAYALACDVAAADGTIAQEEARLLELVRHRFDLDRLASAALERAARVRRLRP